MTSKKTVLLGLILFTIVKSGLTQSIGTRDYIVITFETIRKMPNVTQLSYWIAPVDSIVNKKIFNIYPLYIEEYSNDIYEKCLRGDTVDVFTTTTATNFDFNNEYLQQIESLQSIVRQKGVLVQKVVLDWKNKAKEKERLNIYVTPIKGEFCTCIQVADVRSEPDLDFMSQVFMLADSVSFNNDFWQMELGKIIQITDFSRVDFEGHIPGDTYGRYVSKARTALKPIRYPWK
jgi:hypothetical protein